MEKAILTDNDFCTVAKLLRCKVADIKTVSEVEAKGTPFYDDGFPVILLERHQFYKYASRTFVADPDREGYKITERDLWHRLHPEVCNPEPGGYGKAGQHQKDKFNLAYSLDPHAAMMCCSWGAYQCMGFNFKICGFASVDEMVDAMKESHVKQLLAFALFVLHNHLDDELREHRWAAFAHGYNGAVYAQNAYDKKLAAAFKKHADDKTDCSNLSPSVKLLHTDDSQTSKLPNAIDGGSSQGEDSPQLPALDPSTPSEAEQPAPPAETVEVPQVKAETQEQEPVTGIKASLAAAATFITGTGAGILSWIGGARTEIIYGFFAAASVVGIVFVVSRFWFVIKKAGIASNEKMKREQWAHELQLEMVKAAANKDMNNVVIKPLEQKNSDPPAQVGLLGRFSNE